MQLIWRRAGLALQQHSNHHHSQLKTGQRQDISANLEPKAAEPDHPLDQQKLVHRTDRPIPESGRIVKRAGSGPIRSF
jgi:hypothetical protein